MKWKTRLLVRESAYTAVAFTASLYVYYIAVVWGLQDHFVAGPLRDYLVSGAAHIEIIWAGVVCGGLLGVINRVTETPRLRNRPVVQIVLLRTGMYLVGFAAATAVLFSLFTFVILSPESMASIMRAVTPRNAVSFVFWVVLSVVMINLALELERVLGPGNLWRLFVGRYRRPHEEERVFLFMDLKGSTAAAETLGHGRYSEMLQECYRDLTRVVLQHEAAIYQYVGDEVVMSWPRTSSAHETRAAVHAFFAYDNTLRMKADAYRGRFGTTPKFRGGIAVGPVTVIEVGDVKREIVYHGDVLNTAARLLDKCKASDQSLLVSGSVGEAVKGDAWLRVRWHGEVPLRGKREPVEAYSLLPAVEASEPDGTGQQANT